MPLSGRFVQVFIMVFYVSALLCTNAQEYPFWFTDPARYSSSQTYCGIAEHATFSDSAAIAAAYHDAIIAAVKSQRIHITILKQGLMHAEGRMLWDKILIDAFDSVSVPSMYAEYQITDTFLSGPIVIVRIAREKFPEIKLVPVIPQTEPEWVNRIPKDDGFVYALGSSPEYFYVTSSWKEAEKAAVADLAASQFALITSTEQANEYSYSAVDRAEIQAELIGLQVVARWYDKKKELYYVLMKTEK